jgi:hypothetical protein
MPDSAEYSMLAKLENGDSGRPNLTKITVIPQFTNPTVLKMTNVTYSAG